MDAVAPENVFVGLSEGASAERVGGRGADADDLAYILLAGVLEEIELLFRGEKFGVVEMAM